MGLDGIWGGSPEGLVIEPVESDKSWTGEDTNKRMGM
jgi:hypothetical protein